MVRRTAPRGDHQADLFAASFADIPIRDQRDTMERPFFSLAKKPRLTPIEYQVGNVRVEVSANPKFGMATIWDAESSHLGGDTNHRGDRPGTFAGQDHQVPSIQPAAVYPPVHRRLGL